MLIPYDQMQSILLVKKDTLCYWLYEYYDMPYEMTKHMLKYNLINLYRNLQIKRTKFLKDYRLKDIEISRIETLKQRGYL